jgi:hypothetical protein
VAKSQRGDRMGSARLRSGFLARIRIVSGAVCVLLVLLVVALGVASARRALVATTCDGRAVSGIAAERGALVLISKRIEMPGAALWEPHRFRFETASGAPLWRAAGWAWWPAIQRHRSPGVLDVGTIRLPLWTVCAALVLTAVMLWRPDIVRWRRAAGGRCVGCGYRTAGVMGPCPECGAPA